MSAFASYGPLSPSPFGNVASVPNSPFGSTFFGVPLPSPSPSPSPFPSPFGGNNAFTTNSGHVVSFSPSTFGSTRPSFAFAGTSCNASLGFCNAGGSSVASYRPTNEDDYSSTTMMQSISAMNVYANKSHEELRHEDYQMNNKGRPSSIFGGSFGVPRTPNSLFSEPSANFFAPPTDTTLTPNNAFYDAPPTNPFSLFPSGPPKPSNPFSVTAPFTNPFSPSISPFGRPPKTSSPFSVPSSNEFTPRPQGPCFPQNATTPAHNNPFSRAPSTNFPAYAGLYPVGDINWGPFAPASQPLPENNVEAKSAKPTGCGTQCKFCSLPANPEVVSKTNPSQPTQASSSSTTVKEVGSQDKNGQQNTVASKTQPETAELVQNGSPSIPVEIVLSVGMSSLSIGRSPTEKLDKGEVTENKARASFRVSVDCIDIDDVSSIMPKLPPGNEYYTEPSIEQLGAMERAEPGYCSRVKDFVVGRKDKGSIKFLGETDVRELDLESIVQFNDREVVVYLDETKMPPVGQGLNKPAEVTLLNVKCISKLTGKQYNDGPQLRKYEEKLMEKAAEIGGEFISLDPVKGQWNFRVSHF